MGLASLLAIASLLLVAASFFSAAGLGGGVLYRPALLAGGVAERVAIGTSCALVAVTGLGATAAYARSRLANVKVAAILGLAAMSGAFAGSLLTARMSNRTLSWIASAALLACALTLVGRRTGDSGSEERRLPGPASVVVLFGIGAMSAAAGIGGGALILGYLVAVEGLATRTAIATSALVVGLLGISATAGHVVAGNVQWMTVGLLVPFILVGCMVGTRISLRLSPRGVEWVVAALTAVLAAVFAYRGFWSGS